MPAKDAPKDPRALPAVSTALTAPPKGSRIKKIVIIFLILLMTLSAAGAGAYWWLALRVPVQESATSVPASPAGNTNAGGSKTAPGATPGSASSPRLERPSELPRSTGKVVPLPEFVVNLSDPAGKRYLKLGMEVEVNADVSKAIKENAPKIRDAVIILLAGKSYADVASPEGKILLKAEVGARLNQILGGQYVVRVYFTDFVVQ